jgi:EmrB/QacA subfamily drug resistance transporter
MNMNARKPLIALTVASPMFLQNVDATAMATALPTIAQDFNVPVLDVKLAITAYLLSIAVFLPLTGWLTERFGARRVFCLAIGLFSVASGLCALAGSLPELVAARIGQGLGAALMLPVGRVLLMHATPAAAMVQAMTWFTVPPVLGRLTGPLVGGAILSVSTWHWIFLIHIPLGVLFIASALYLVDDVPATEAVQPLDRTGYLLLATGLASLVGAVEALSAGFISGPGAAGVAAFGVACLGLYVWHSLRAAHPLIDLRLLKVRTFRTNVMGGFPLRLSVFAAPFLIPLLLQVGFGLSPLVSGAMAGAAGIGALCTRFFMRSALRRWGFRNMVLAGTTGWAALTMGCALFEPSTPIPVMGFFLFLGSLVGSLSMVSLNTLGYADVPGPLWAQSATLSAVMQQLATGLAVMVAGWMVMASAWVQGHEQAQWPDFSMAFVGVGAVALLSIPAFLRLRNEDGASLRASQKPS